MGAGVRGVRTIPSTAYSLLRLGRPKQWVKNTFVLAPLVFARSFTDPVAIQQALFALAMFCIASSACYVVNDIKDIERDRAHPIKSWSRPLAAGHVSLNAAMALLAALYAVLVAGFILHPALIVPIGGYIALNLAYSFYLKNQPVLDIFSVAGGFVLRIYAGAEAINVPLSSWMAVTTLCLALYLAAIKRRQELVTAGSEGRRVLKDYSVNLVDRYAEMSAVGALIFYSLFVMSSNPQLVITIPMVIFGLFRYWYLVETRESGESPTDVLLTDWPLIACILAWGAACLYALMGSTA
ncbi:MAG: decaprenyl-phosphate phosphoribosyltransferase [Reyranella sp.]|uniref:decaprenyl-phosphate phosphoribosyltransferase n=1 Tax=Reyranella sp. TaxID=1929291 RepID=UPI001AD3DCB6|nr:decaprenyl-phosphate phosphoribosyltransferase [Reyranella sp.]MBN9088882.1 decaprenyl-phosphate phosphoribosyltransferase [Reyranella sp.]